MNFSYGVILSSNGCPNLFLVGLVNAGIICDKGYYFLANLGMRFSSWHDNDAG